MPTNRSIAGLVINSTAKSIVCGAALAAVVLLLTLGVYWPGLTGPLLFDDFPNLSPLLLVERYGGWDGVFHYLASNNSGPLGRPVSLLSFLLDDATWPVVVIELKTTNLLLHAATAATALILFVNLARLAGLSGSRQLWTALFAALLWAIHPINISTTLYVIQRMALLATLFSLWALIFFIWGRDLIERHLSSTAVAYLLLSSLSIGLAVLSKENGILVVGLILLVETLFYPKQSGSYLYKSWRLLVLWGPIIALIGYFALTWNSIMASYAPRAFTFPERMWTEGRVLWSYAWAVLNPLAVKATLYSDDIVVSTGPFAPVTSILSWLAILATIVLSFILRKKLPVFTLAVGWFLIAHVIESSFIPLEIAFEHRNYLPAVGPAFAMVYGLSCLLAKVADSRRRLMGGALLALILLGVALLSRDRAAWWGNENALHALWAMQSPNSIRAQTDYALQLAINGKTDEAVALMARVSQAFPRDLVVHLNRGAMECRFGGRNIDLQQYLQSPEHWQIRRVAIISAMEGLTRIAEGKHCEGVDAGTLSRLLDLVLADRKVQAESATQAMLLYMYANYRFSLGDGETAIKLLDKVALLQRTVDVPLRQTTMLMELGDYDGAMSYAIKARELDATRGRRQASRMTEILKLMASIEARREQ